MTVVQITLMTEAEARACVGRVKSKLEDIRADLAALKEREGWRALGYQTWEDCIREEFAMSRQRAHQLINAYTVGRILAAGPDVNIVDAASGVAEIPESHARELGPLLTEPDILREVHGSVMEATGGRPTAADYRRAVEGHLGLDDGALEEAPDPAVAAAAMADAQALLEEPEEERAYYLIGRQRFWMKLEPERVADTSAVPDQDAPEWEAFTAWCGRVASSLRARARQRVRLVE